jgi:GT2 family glycosyltransferase
MSNRLWIVVLVYNGLQDTRTCLQSLAAVTDPSVTTVVVDNGSEPELATQLAQEFPWARVLRNPSNEGYAGGNNRGIELALREGAEWVLVMNNDTTVAPDLARVLLDAAAAHPDYGVIGPVIGFMEERDAVMTDGCLFNRPGYPGFFDRLPVPLAPAADAGGGAPPVVVPVDIVNGCAMMISAAAFRAAGLIDERFFLVHEESDLCLRVRRAGLKCGVLGRMLVWHKGSSSFKRSGKRLQRYYDARNLQLLLRKQRAAHAEGRGARDSWVMYVKYVYYRYCVELEAGQPDAAQAVLEGVHDGLLGRFGGFAPRRRVLMPLLTGLFALRRRLSPAPASSALS